MAGLKAGHWRYRTPWLRALRPPFAADGGLVGRRDPGGPEWQYEPKWDGFRCLVFRDGDTVELQSKSGKPLTRYFPEVVEAVRGAQGQDSSCSTARSSCRDGKAFSFDALLQRIHPAASRVKKLAEETPALLIVFDLLADGRRHAGRRAADRSGASGWRRSPKAILRRADASGCRRRPPSSPMRRNG